MSTNSEAIHQAHPHTSLRDQSEAPVAAWRRTILDGALGLAASIFALVITVTLLQGGAPGRQLAGLLLPGFVPVLLGLLWRSGPFTVRAFLMLGGYWAGIFAAGMARGPGIPNPWVAAVFACVLAALVLERRLAWLATTITSVLWVVVAVWWTTGKQLPADHFADPTEPGNWVRLVLIYSFFSFATVSAVLFFVSRLEEALRRSDSLVHALQEESGRRLEDQRQRHALELRLQQAQRLEALGTLAGTMAHDVNNLLQVIAANAELAMEERDPQRRRQATQDLSTASERASNLTRQLLAFSRHRTAESAPVDVRSAVDESVGLLAPLAPTLEVSVEHQGELPPVFGSVSGVQQIVMNLVLNARDAMASGGRVWVRTGLVSNPATGWEADYVLVAVRDEGPGMDAETARQVFDPFFTTRDAGTGLGLHLVRSIAESTGGFATLRSEVGVGTEVQVYLAPSDASVKEQPPPATRATPGHGRRVLLVDDDRLVRRVMSRYLLKAGFELVEADGGEPAIRAFRTDPKSFDIVVCDAIMPEVGGREVFDAVRAIRPDVPFLVCSGYTADVFEDGFFDAPHLAFLGKPFQHTELMGKLSELLEESSAS